MIERKRYLELCQKNAVYGNQIIVMFEEKEYFPQRLEIWFDVKGNTKNTAVLLDKNLKTIIHALIEKVEEKHETYKISI